MGSLSKYIYFYIVATVAGIYSKSPIRSDIYNLRKSAATLATNAFLVPCQTSVLPHIFLLVANFPPRLLTPAFFLSPFFSSFEFLSLQVFKFSSFPIIFTYQGSGHGFSWPSDHRVPHVPHVPRVPHVPHVRQDNMKWPRICSNADLPVYCQT